VETNADRDRKGVKGTDDIDSVSTKYDTKIPSFGPARCGSSMTPPFECGIIFPSSVLRCSEEGILVSYRGTEGGVSEKGKEGKLTSEKAPGGPKEAPPLPHSVVFLLSGPPDADHP
jgi:hypothetical protein